MTLVPAHEVTAFLEAHSGWTTAGDSVTRTFSFEDFVGAIGFVSRVALLAEKADHHPDIDIRWNKVRLTLSTHSEGGITARDLDLADRCDHLV